MKAKRQQAQLRSEAMARKGKALGDWMGSGQPNNNRNHDSIGSMNSQGRNQGRPKSRRNNHYQHNNHKDRPYL